MLGLINEIAGENGLGWQRRHLLIKGNVSNPATDQRTKDFWHRFGGKYLFSEEAAAAAPARVASILKFLAERLDRQKAKGGKFFIGDKLSAVDIYWATFAALIRPMAPELCPWRRHFAKCTRRGIR
jgi:glutathione S-transferase